MDTALADLITALQVANDKLSAVDLDAVLHNNEGLPDKVLVGQASKVLDQMDALRLRLEPRHLILADHFMGT